MSDTQPQPPAVTSNVHLLAPVGLVIVGILGLIGGLLPWVSVTTVGGGFSQSIQTGSIMPGSSNWREAVAAALGAFILSCAAAYLFGRGSRILPVVSAVLSVMLLAWGVYNIADVYRQANDLYNEMDKAFASFPAAATGVQVPNFRDFFHVDPAAGLWMVAIAGLIGTVLSLVVWLRKPPVPAAAVPVQPFAPAPVWEPPPPAPAPWEPRAVRPADPPDQIP